MLKIHKMLNDFLGLINKDSKESILVDLSQEDIFNNGNYYRPNDANARKLIKIYLHSTGFFRMSNSNMLFT